jgi:hypothetical protein
MTIEKFILIEKSFLTSFIPFDVTEKFFNTAESKDTFFTLIRIEDAFKIIISSKSGHVTATSSFRSVLLIRTPCWRATSFN